MTRWVALSLQEKSDIVKKLNREQQRLVNELDWVAKTVAYRAFSTKYGGNAASLEDITQVARLGICAAVVDYDPTKGSKLSTYCWTRAQAYVGHFYRDKTRMIRVPREEQSLYYKVMNLLERGGCSEEDAAKKLGITMERLKTVMRVGTTEPGPLFDETESDQLVDSFVTSERGEILKGVGDLLNERELEHLLIYLDDPTVCDKDRVGITRPKLNCTAVKSSLQRVSSYIEEISLTEDDLW